MIEVESFSLRLLMGSGWGVALHVLCLIALLLGPCAVFYRWRRLGGGRAEWWTHISPARVLFASAVCVLGYINVDPLKLNGTLTKVVVFEGAGVFEVEVTSLLKRASRITPIRVERWTLDTSPLQGTLDAQARLQANFMTAREVSLLDDATCAADVSGSDGDGHSLVPGLTLTQPRLIQRRERGGEAQVCSLRWNDAKGEVMFALHSVGEEAARTLSALRVKSPRTPLWTVDLGDALGPSWMTPRYRVADPQVRSSDQVCFWLIRAEESLSEVCVDMATGALRSAKVLF
jgi:hypothetical protein